MPVTSRDARRRNVASSHGGGRFEADLPELGQHEVVDDVDPLGVDLRVDREVRRGVGHDVDRDLPLVEGHDRGRARPQGPSRGPRPRRSRAPPRSTCRAPGRSRPRVEPSEYVANTFSGPKLVGPGTTPTADRRPARRRSAPLRRVRARRRRSRRGRVRYSADSASSAFPPLWGTRSNGLASRRLSRGRLLAIRRPLPSRVMARWSRSGGEPSEAELEAVLARQLAVARARVAAQPGEDRLHVVRKRGGASGRRPLPARGPAPRGRFRLGAWAA